MKKIIINLLVLFPLFVLTGIYGQNTQEGKNLNDILSIAKEANGVLYSIYDLKVFRYYNLTEEYDTDLKKEVFKRTQEYAEKWTELKKIKAEMAKTLYYVKQEDLFKGANYDINKKGFYLTIGQNWGMGTASAKAPKSVLIDRGYFFGSVTIYLKALSSKQVPYTFLGEGIYNEKLLIPMNETNALEVEENRDNILVYYFLTPTGKETVTYEYYCTTYGWYNMKETLLKSDKVRILVANKETGKIYFNKTYTYQKPGKK